MLIEVTRPLRAKFSNGVIHLVPGSPVELSDDQARRLLQKAPDAVRIVGSPPDPPPPTAQPDPVATALAMAIEAFAAARLIASTRCIVEYAAPAYIVSSPTERAVLRREGVAGHVWTIRECALALAPDSPRTVRAVLEAWNATVTEVRHIPSSTPEKTP